MSPLEPTNGSSFEPTAVSLATAQESAIER
jgi:hypothetical protein